MKNVLFKKTIVIGLIVLFIGASVIPVITASTDVLLIDNSDELPVNLLKNKKAISNIGNEPPVMKPITGPTRVIVGQINTWNFEATDVDNLMVQIHIDWGDNTHTTSPLTPVNWPYPATHIYYIKDPYNISAYATDLNGGESERVYLDIVCPLISRQLPNIQFFRILERFPNAFPILKHMLGL